VSVPTISSSVLAAMPPESLAELANDAAKQAEHRAKTTAEAALLAGQALAAAKEQIEHGSWESWLSENWNYHQSLARRYMQIAKRYSGSVLENRSVRSLLAEMSEPSDDTDQPKASSVETYDAPIEVTAREPEKPEKQPSVKVRDPKPKKPVGEFILTDRLDADREKILDLAGEYLEHKKLQNFVSLLKGLLQELLSGDLEP
jgi:hypothetical protein